MNLMRPWVVHQVGHLDVHQSNYGVGHVSGRQSDSDGGAILTPWGGVG